MTVQTKTATVVEELVQYDGPQLLLLANDRGRHMFAVAVRHSPMKEPFFSCEVGDRAYDRYFAGTADLHYAFQQAVGNRYYFFDLADSGDGKVRLERATASDVESSAYWPKVGFFSRSHTTSFNLSVKASAVRHFKIDGKWGASDFSHFHGKMSDLYALFGVIDRLDGANSATERGFIREVIKDRFWQGGGSYVGFYDSLLQRNKLLQVSPLEVAKIHYASPGELVLRGNNQALSDIADVMTAFELSTPKLHETYWSIYRSLRKEGLLSAKPTVELPSSAFRAFLLKSVRELGALMNLEKIEDIYAASDKNALVFAKVVLSIYRRANEIYSFHAEGRVQRRD
jgi:hypothetical protein